MRLHVSSRSHANIPCCSADTRGIRTTGVEIGIGRAVDKTYLERCLGQGLAAARQRDDQQLGLLGQIPPRHHLLTGLRRRGRRGRQRRQVFAVAAAPPRRPRPRSDYRLGVPDSRQDRIFVAAVVVLDRVNLEEAGFRVRVCMARRRVVGVWNMVIHGGWACGR